jgi:hypothetical protein
MQRLEATRQLKSVSITRFMTKHCESEGASSQFLGLLNARWLTAEGRDFRVTRLGKKKLAALDIDLAAVGHSSRAFARVCVDLTQRRPHLGGALAAALLDLYIARGWVLPIRRSRAVNITPRGDEAFRKLFA